MSGQLESEAETQRSLLELARKLIAIDSTTAHGTEDLARFLSELAASWGLHADMLLETSNGVSNANVLITKKSIEAAQCPLILTAALDPAEPGEYGLWIKTGANPFKASLDGDSLFGLGAADAKCDLLTKMLALKTAKTTSAAVVGTFGRESATGTIRLIRRKKIKPKFALVASPTDLAIANRAPGFAKVEITLPLSVAERRHIERQNISEGSYSQSKIFSASPSGKVVNLGLHDNPIIKMIDYLKNLPSGIAILSVDGGTSAETSPDFVELEVQIVDAIADGVITKLLKIGELVKRFSAELKVVEEKSFSPSHSTINVGQIRMLAEAVKITGICRLVPAREREIYEQWLERLRQDCAAAGAQFQILDYKPPFSADKSSTFFGQLKGVSSQLGLSQEIVAAHQCTEANALHKLGVETAAFGAGRWRGVEQAALEHVEIKDLAKAVDFYRAVIEKGF